MLMLAGSLALRTVSRVVGAFFYNYEECYSVWGAVQPIPRPAAAHYW